MRSSAHLEGHPIHPMLVGFPAAYLFGSACIDACAAAADRPDWFRTARHMRALGIATALVAAVPGIIDYVFAVPPKSSAKTRATNHMIANVSALALFGLARFDKRADAERPSWPAMTAELCGAGLVAVAGWLGGTLVYRNQIAVDHRFANAGKWHVSAIPESRIHGDRIDVGRDDQLQDEQMTLLRAGGKRVALGRTKGRLVAFADRCTHKGGPLSDGTLACGIVQCPWHGSQFNVNSGAVEQGPAEQPIETYDVDSSGGRATVARRPRR
jgi:nitrite reductase/ring-hydroxylating ferredoxin subunit/uncharacterized membrane protein